MEIMQPPEAPGRYVMAELRAREDWKNRDYSRAFAAADEAAGLALEQGDRHSWWQMKYLQAECLLEQGLVQECLSASRELASDALSVNAPSLKARVLTLIAVGSRGLGQLQAAIDAAESAIAAAEMDKDSEILQITAHHALIAAIAESGRVEEAWDQCLALESLLGSHIDAQARGKAYWTIGNVAFLRQQLRDGVEYHSKAATLLSPANDVDMWGKFNKGSAALRLAAGVADADTLQCIERAELANEIIGGNLREQLELSLTRAHWLLLTGSAQDAVTLLQSVTAQSDSVAVQTAGEANFLLGKALAQLDETRESLKHLEQAAEQFASAGVEDNVAEVQSFIAKHSEP